MIERNMSLSIYDVTVPVMLQGLERTAMKRQFCMWKDVGAVVPIRTSSRIWSSLKVTAGS
jgi:hypothetical protein